MAVHKESPLNGPSVKDPTPTQALQADERSSRIEDVGFLLRVANGETNGIVHATQGAPSTARKYSTTTRLIHADDHLNGAIDVAPPLHVSTTFRYPEDPNHLITAKDIEVNRGSYPLTHPHLPSPTKPRPRRTYASSNILKSPASPPTEPTATSIPGTPPPQPPASKPSLPPSCTPQL